jgi:hypothetical protein
VYIDVIWLLSLVFLMLLTYQWLFFFFPSTSLMKSDRAGGVAQAVEPLPFKHETLGWGEVVIFTSRTITVFEVWLCVPIMLNTCQLLFCCFPDHTIVFYPFLRLISATLLLPNTFDFLHRCIIM